MPYFHGRICDSLKYFFYIYLLCTSSTIAKLTAQLNPGCTFCEKQYIIEIIQHDNVSSTHFIIAAAELPVIIPSGIVFQSKLPTRFDWQKIVRDNVIEGAITIPNSTYYGIAFPHLYPYLDDDDVANVTKATLIEKWSLSQCFWQLLDNWNPVSNSETELITIKFKCVDTRQHFFKEKGYIEFSITVSGRTQKSSRAPHLLLYGGLSILFRMTFSNLKDPWAKRTRYSLPVTMVSNNIHPPDQNFETEKVTAADAELSPGTFTDEYVYLGRSPGEKSNRSNLVYPAFLHWRSVCFVNKSAAEVKYSRRISVSQQGTHITLKDLSYSLIAAVVSRKKGRANRLLPTVRTVNISFGEPGDQFFAATRYLDWTMVMSLGDPPSSTDHSSLTVTLLVFSCFLLFLAISSLLFMAVRFCVLFRRQRDFFLFSSLINASSEPDMKS